MIVSSVLTGVASAIPAALPSSLAASTSSWVMSDPAQPARAAVVINSIIIVASIARITYLRQCKWYIPSHTQLRSGASRHTDLHLFEMNLAFARLRFSIY